MRTIFILLMVQLFTVLFLYQGRMLAEVDNSSQVALQAFFTNLKDQDKKDSPTLSYHFSEGGLDSPSCLHRSEEDCEGEFHYRAALPKNEWNEPPSSLDDFLPQTNASTSKSSCINEWNNITIRNAGNKQYPKSTNREDMLIYSEYFASNEKVDKGFYIEMGAFDGVAESNSRFFERCLGWDGLLIEANPNSYSKLVKNRPRAHTMKLAPGCSTDNETIDFFSIPFTNSMTLDLWKEKHSLSENDMTKVSRIHCGPFSLYLAELGITHVDFFSLDVEGSEANILSTIDFNAVCFHVILVESSNAGNRGGDSPQNLKVRSILEANGFTLYRNTIPKSDVYINQACG